MGILIRDSFTLTATVPAKRGRPALTFVFRPALPERVYDYLAAPRDSGKKRLRAVTDLLLEHLRSWDATLDTDDTVPITRESLARVPHETLEFMVNHVTGYGDEEAAADAGN
jgi:hypothetical protein